MVLMTDLTTIDPLLEVDALRCLSSKFTPIAPRRYVSSLSSDSSSKPINCIAFAWPNWPSAYPKSFSCLLRPRSCLWASSMVRFLGASSLSPSSARSEVTPRRRKALSELMCFLSTPSICATFLSLGAPTALTSTCPTRSARSSAASASLGLGGRVSSAPLFPTSLPRAPRKSSFISFTRKLTSGSAALCASWRQTLPSGWMVTSMRPCQPCLGKSKCSKDSAVVSSEFPMAGAARLCVLRVEPNHAAGAWRKRRARGSILIMQLAHGGSAEPALGA
mmetsp:Transcript_7471/g.21743  ORF Transcript_7471/g.21743 Transcript_7471/m.21743 type:complete len:277 (-) Transcript_7471:346-1176(-)